MNVNLMKMFSFSSKCTVHCLVSSLYVYLFYMSIHCCYGVSLVLRKAWAIFYPEKVGDMKDLQEGVREAGVSVLLLLLTHPALPPSCCHIVLTLTLGAFPTSLGRAFRFAPHLKAWKSLTWRLEKASLEKGSGRRDTFPTSRKGESRLPASL